MIFCVPFAEGTQIPWWKVRNHNGPEWGQGGAASPLSAASSNESAPAITPLQPNPLRHGITLRRQATSRFFGDSQRMIRRWCASAACPLLASAATCRQHIQCSPFSTDSRVMIFSRPRYPPRLAAERSLHAHPFPRRPRTMTTRPGVALLSGWRALRTTFLPVFVVSPPPSSGPRRLQWASGVPRRCA